VSTAAPCLLRTDCQSIHLCSSALQGWGCACCGAACRTAARAVVLKHKASRALPRLSLLGRTSPPLSMHRRHLTVEGAWPLPRGELRSNSSNRGTSGHAVSAKRVYGYAPSALQQAFDEASSRCRVTQLWMPEQDTHGYYSPTRAQWLPDWHGVTGDDMFGAQPGMGLDGPGAQGLVAVTGVSTSASRHPGLDLPQ
jgi:hypothetical protein